MNPKHLAIGILAYSDEEPFIENVLLRLLDLTESDIWVFDDSEPGNDKLTLTIMKNKAIYQSKRVFIEPIPASKKTFDKKRNYMHYSLTRRNYKAILHMDVDEEFDPWFLMNAPNLLDQYSDYIAFKFPRINRPFGNNYPDWQVRLLRLDERIKWERELHEVPMFSRENGNSKINLHDFIETLPLKNFPILHHKRNARKPRIWWTR